MKTTSLIAVAASLVVTAGSLAVAQAPVPPPQTPLSTPMPSEQRQGGVSFVTGGITSDEAAAFRAASPNYSLAVEMSQRDREYVSEVVVSITDPQGGELLRTQADGPFVLARLPPGQYQVRADNGGKVRSETVNIAPGQSRHLLLTW